MTSPTAEASEVQLAPEATSAAEARAFVRRFLLKRDLHYVADDVCLVVSELITNAVLHARTPVQVRIEELPFCVKLTVYDQAVDRRVLNLRDRMDADDEGGRGLWFVDACSEDWGTEPVGEHGKCTWALFAVRPRSSWIADP
jgi:anti-sigma regulatory factor (Ser/Thr protein kinase)